jgi:magnesium transporter
VSSVEAGRQYAPPGGAGSTREHPERDTSLDTLRFGGGRWRTEQVPVSRVGSVVAQDEGFVWLDLRGADVTHMAGVAAQLGLPGLAVEDAVQAHQRPKLEQYGDLAFMVFKPVVYRGAGRGLSSSEIALFLGARFVVTVQHGDTGLVQQVRQRLAESGATGAVVTPATVLHRLADVIVDEYERTLQAVDEEIDDVEGKVFGRDDGDHAECIYELKQGMAELRRAVAPLTVPLQRLAAGAVPGVEEALLPYFRDVHDHVLRAADSVEAADRLLSDVLQGDMSRVSVRQNEIALRQNDVAARQNEDMRKISAWAAIGLVPTSIAGIYGMNFDNMPELHWQYGYFAALAVIISVCLALYLLFRRNDWL